MDADYIKGVADAAPPLSVEHSERIATLLRPALHAAGVGSEDEPTMPWPFVTARSAARQLGVPIELINGLAAERRADLRAVKTAGRSGSPVWLLNRDDVVALKQRMAAGRRAGG